MNPRDSSIRRLVLRVLLVCLSGTQCLPGTVSAVELGDVPMATKGRAKPNLIIGLDDSGSMDFEVIPAKGFSSNGGEFWWNATSRSFIGWGTDASGVTDVWNGGGSAPTAGGSGFFNTSPPRGPINFNGGGTAAVPWYEYDYLFPNGFCDGVSSCDARLYTDAWGFFAVPPTREFGWTRSALYNALYYNPAINYDPWRPYNNGTTTTTPANYDNTSAVWSAVRSHPMFPTSGSPVTFDLTAVRPASSVSDNTFAMFEGMIMPGGSTYRVCNADGSSCGSWTAGSAGDSCLVPTSSTTASYCHFAGTYGVTGTTVIGSSRRLDVQIAYRPATVWVLSSGTGALAADEAWGPDGRRLKRIEITSSVASYSKAATRTDCAGATCSYAEELTNFANWFAYYRKRHLMVNGALGLAFDQLTGLRAGRVRFNSLSDATMYDFDNTSDSLNAKRLLHLIYNARKQAGTPTRRTLEYVAQQFARTDANAPVNASCQFNAAFIVTDGYASNSGPSTAVGNADSSTSNRYTIPYTTTEPKLNYTNATPAGTKPLPPTDPLPAVTVVPVHPYKDGESDTLGDIAMNVYSTNPRSDLTKRNVPVDRYDETANADRNDYLHVNTYALALGVQGLIFGRSDTADNIALNKNPFDTSITWSWPSVSNGAGGYKEYHPAAIDELWHATINGRGMMMSTSSPEETRVGVVDIVNNVGAKGGAGAAVAVANPNVLPGDNYSYASNYNSGPWSGDLNKYEINTSTGAVSSTALWTPSPQKQLAVRPPGDRIIATYKSESAGSAGVPFQWASLATAQKDLLTSTVSGVTAADSQVLDFLRGERSREVEKFRSRGPRPVTDVATGNYQTVAGKYVYTNGVTPSDIAVLGDIVHAEPVVVRGPNSNYIDSGYASFKSASATRQSVAYQGANDGMLHAFDLTTGAELWAYVPNLVFGNLRNLSDRVNFRHRYTVDGTPVVRDIDFSLTSGNDLTSPPAADWRTILVSGLRKGGFGYYALDVTNPAFASESALAAKVLWEFPNAQTDGTDPALRAKVGYSFGKPLVVKTRAAGWVVLVTSGYNNGTGTDSSGGDGVGRVWVLNPTNGTVIRELTTATGTASSPSGLAELSAFANRPDIDPTIEAAYGGDLLGNVWRFDLSGSTTSSWSVARLATLTTGTGDAQPVTTEPELGLVNGKRVVFVGTGQYLADSDVLNNSPENTLARRGNSFYALKDDLAATPTALTRSNLVQQTVTKTGSTLTITNNAVNFTTGSGWFLDLPETGERSTTNPALSGGVLVFTTNIPDGTDPCSPGGSSWIYFVDYATGGRITGATSAGSRLGTFLASRVVLVRLPSGQIVGLVRTSDAATVPTNIPGQPAATSGRRVSWREIPDTLDN